MKNLNSLSVILFLLITIFISSCKKDTDPFEKQTTILEASFFETEQTLTHTEGNSVDYIINDLIYLEKALIINAGVTIEFGPDAGFEVNIGGSINIAGTNTARVILTGKSKTKGYWRGLLFESNSSQNKLHFVDIDYAGSTTFNSNGDQASVIVWADAKLDVLSCNITNGGLNGISMVYSGSSVNISNTKITSCIGIPLLLNLNYLSAIDGSNDFHGNGKDYINIVLNISEELEEDFTMFNENVPYRLSSYNSFFTDITVSSGVLTIQAGVTILFEENTGLYASENGAIHAEGTSTNKIIFEGVNKDKGSWKGIYFRQTQSSQNIIKYAEINYAGTTFDNMNGGILMNIDPKVTIENVEFNNIDGCAIFNGDTQDNPNLTSSNNTESNTNGLICHE